MGMTKNENPHRRQHHRSGKLGLGGPADARSIRRPARFGSSPLSCDVLQKETFPLPHVATIASWSPARKLPRLRTRPGSRVSIGSSAHTRRKHSFPRRLLRPSDACARARRKIRLPPLANSGDRLDQDRDQRRLRVAQGASDDLPFVLVPLRGSGPRPLPTRALAQSEACAVQAFEIPGKPVFGIQFHPERDIPGAETTFARIRQSRGIPMLFSTPDRSQELYDPKVGEQIFKNFYEL